VGFGAPAQAKICDFGLAKHAATTTASTYTPASKAYTLEYTSPTRLQEFTRSYQDDVYAFGILMYFIATCDSPFHDIDKGEGSPQLPPAFMLSISPFQILPLTPTNSQPTPLNQSNTQGRSCLALTDTQAPSHPLIALPTLLVYHITTVTFISHRYCRTTTAPAM
jgi:serine/threonine protein kinase